MKWRRRRNEVEERGGGEMEWRRDGVEEKRWNGEGGEMKWKRRRWTRWGKRRMYDH